MARARLRDFKEILTDKLFTEMTRDSSFQECTNKRDEWTLGCRRTLPGPATRKSLPASGAQERSQAHRNSLRQLVARLDAVLPKRQEVRFFPFSPCHVRFPSRPRSTSRLTSTEEKPVTSLPRRLGPDRTRPVTQVGSWFSLPFPVRLARGAWRNTGKTLQTLPGPALPKGLLPPGARTLSAFPVVSDLGHGREHLPRSKPVAGTRPWRGLLAS